MNTRGNSSRVSDSRSILAALLTTFLVGLGSTSAQTVDEIIQRTTATYAAMKSYSDSGTVVTTYGQSTTGKHTFSTLFQRTPRRFLLDFNKQGGDEFVIWADPDAFHTWWKTTRQQSDYANPNNSAAISMSGPPTVATALKIPTLLYAKAALGGDFSSLEKVALSGKEDIGPHHCYRIGGEASDSYLATGKRVNIRRMTLWIDTGSALIIQVREEWTKSVPETTTTTTYQPQANPTLDESRIRFSPPETK